MSEIISYLHKAVKGQNLSREESSRAFQIIMLGGATPAQVAAFVTALRMKGETIEEIAGAALTMRAKAKRITAPLGAIDTCGTGGDSSGTYNISTAVALVVAACGVPVAKHGNRAVSSYSGSADVLQAVGVNLEADVVSVQNAINEAGICFMMAPIFHPAMRHVAPIRKELGIRTIFNLLGPLSNPASAEYQLLGVYDKAWTEPLARVLKELGVKSAWVVHGSDGMDELTTTGSSFVSELKDGAIRSFEITPEEAGLERVTPESLQGGDVEHNAMELKYLLNSKHSAYRDIVLYNAAAALLIAGKVPNLTAGVAMAAQAIDSGAAKETLAKLVEATNNPAI